MQMTSNVEIITKNASETKKLGTLFAQEIYEGNDRSRTSIMSRKHATVISLEGDLGTGKTTFAQGFAEGLGIKEKIQSPTYVILKIYKIKKYDFIHIDAYRVGSKDFTVLGWKDFIKNPQNIIVVEWGTKIKKILPKNTIHILFTHQKVDERRIKITK